MLVRPQTPLPSSFDALVDSWVAAPAPPLPPPSPLSPLSSPLPRIPSPPLLLPLPTCRDIIPEADMSPQKRARFAAPSQRFEIGESSAAAAYRLWICDRLGGAVLRASVSSLERQRRYHRTTTIAAEQEATSLSKAHLPSLTVDLLLACYLASVTPPFLHIAAEANLGILDITKAEQIALDDALVAPANRLKIGKCNLRLSSDLKSKEVTLQVVYDVLKLTGHSHLKHFSSLS
ncbi:hypothetical protein Tco_0105549 [Tanacetum coccineum]